ncbi:hypothetical protein N9P98_03310 [Flavobacteriaceae bacterium]|nr:hypothetical protein [Flavobacteriaceae bacterium]
MKNNKKCSICKGNLVPFGFESDDITLWGNNPQPFRNENGVMLDFNERCCIKCNDEIVLPLRLALLHLRPQIRINPDEDKESK